MAAKIHLPHPDIVSKWKEEKVIKWLKRVHLDDCIPAFEIRHINGSNLLELDEKKLFTTYQDLKIKQKKQIAKCVQECKSQATNAKRIAKAIRKKQKSHPDSIENGTYLSDDDSDDWGSDFEDESDDEVNIDDQVPELNNNTIIQPPCVSSKKNSLSNSSPENTSVIPQPPDVPVISKITNGNRTTGRKGSNSTNSIPRPPIKRPPSQPPPPPVAKQLPSQDLKQEDHEIPDVSTPSEDLVQEDYEIPNVPTQLPSQDLEQENYEIPIVSKASSVKEISDILNSSSQSINASNFAAETYELIDPPEETYEMVDDLNSTTINLEKPALPPRLPLSSGSISPPPPLPQKPKKLLNDRLDGVRTFSRPKPPPPKPEPETELAQQPSVSNVGFLGTLMGRRPSNTYTTSPKSEKKNKDCPDGNLSSNHSVVSSSDGLSSRSSSPDKDGSSSSSDSKKCCSMPVLPSRGAQPLSDEAAQNMATRPLPPVPTLVPEEKKTMCNSKEDLSSYPWFHELERQMAEEVVKSLNESGSFVVRPSKRAGVENPYSLTIFHNEKLFHLNIRIRPDNTYALGKEKKVEKTFSTVADLIAFHQTDPIILTSRGEPAGKTILCKYPEKS